MELHVEAFGNARAKPLNQLVGISLELSWVDLDHQPDTLLIGNPHRKCCRASGPDCWVNLLGEMLDVLRVEIAPANDDEVLAPPRHVELAIEHEAEIPGIEPRFVALSRYLALEGIAGGFWALPIPLPHDGTM